MVGIKKRRPDEDKEKMFWYSDYCSPGPEHWYVIPYMPFLNIPKIRVKNTQPPAQF